MRAAAFDYVAPESLPAALEALERGGYDAKLIAGGQSLVPMMNFRLARPELLVDIRKVRELAGVTVGPERVMLGATTTHREIERSEELARVLPIMREAAHEIGHPGIRNRGTIGGSVAHADGAAEWPIVTAALGAVMHVAGPRGTRTVDARDFFVSYFTTALEFNEVVTAVEIPVPRPGTGWGFRELSRQAGAFALSLVAAVAALDPDGRVVHASLAVGGVSATPVLPDVSTLGLVGSIPTPTALDEAASVVAEELRPPSDVHATAEDRREIARALVRRALADALLRAGADRLELESGP